MNEKAKKAAGQSGALLIIAAGILVGINALSALGGYTRKDITKSQRYSLSDGSRRLVRSMKQEMKVEVYVTKGLPKLDAFVNDLRDLMQEYKTGSNGKFDYEIKEPKTEEEKKAAKELGLTEIPFGESNDTEEKMGLTQGYMGLVMKYGSEKDVVPVLDPGQTEGMEFWITNKIREVSDKADEIKHKIGLVTGHDEIKISEANLLPSNQGKASLQQILQRFPFYQLSDVDLKAGEAEVDESYEGLIITQPTKDYTEKELRRIDQFLMKGKSLAVFASAVNVKASDATMSATLNTHGLEKLLSGYGLELGKDALIDQDRAFRVQVRAPNGGVGSVLFPQVLDVQNDASMTEDAQRLDTGFAAFFRIPGISLPFASSIVMHEEKQPKEVRCEGLTPDQCSFRLVARSSLKTVREVTDTVDLKPFQKWRSKGAVQRGQHGIAANVEGVLKSAFQEGDKMGVERSDKSAKPARIMLIASSQFLANPFARAGNGPDMGQMAQMMPGGGGDEQLMQLAVPYAQQALTNTIIVFKNTLDWLTGDMNLLAVSAKILNEPNLVYDTAGMAATSDDETDDQIKKRNSDMRQARKKQQRNVEIALIGVLPLLFALFGFWRSRSRASAREQEALI
jgi:ABC-type uncharacterized transport system involved in gliding motility auxiliary subunit